MRNIHKSFLDTYPSNKERQNSYNYKRITSRGFKLGRRVRIYCPGYHFYFIKEHHLDINREPLDMDLRLALVLME
jgi:hypothetical protein